MAGHEKNKNKKKTHRTTERVLCVLKMYPERTTRFRAIRLASHPISEPNATCRTRWHVTALACRLHCRSSAPYYLLARLLGATYVAAPGVQYSSVDRAPARTSDADMQSKRLGGLAFAVATATSSPSLCASRSPTAAQTRRWAE